MNVAAVVLAAGMSRRMGGPNKLTASVNGKPLVRIAVEAALASRAGATTVVTGHDADAVAAALAGLPVTLIHNADYADGMSTSLRAGIAAVPAEADGAVVLLGDMPAIDAAAIERVIAAFAPGEGADIVVATAAGQQRNPVLWSRRFFAQLMAQQGDKGGREVIAANPAVAVTVELGSPAAADIDTPEDLAASGRPASVPPQPRRGENR